jgi:serine/threonine-protein kinase
MMSPETIGRYRIKSRIGKGGMATIFLAHDPLFGRDVAVKVLPREFLHDPSFRGRFEREARVIATLEHPAIVPVYDFGEDTGQPYLVMRYMRGGSLADRLENGPLPVDQSAYVVGRIGSALDHAHKKGIIHRDLKPANILFDEYGEPFLADFGIVKVAESTANLTGGGILGTPAYMSPEQVHGDQQLDGRSDIYTLGVILFEMLTGQMPYRADTPAKLMMAHVLNPAPRVLDLNPDLPPACNTVILRAMAKNRDERYTTAGAMARMLSGTDAETISSGSTAEAQTVLEPLPTPTPAPAGTPPPGTPPDVQTPPPYRSPTPAPAAPAKSGSGRSRLLIPILGGVVGLGLCCLITLVVVSQFGGLLEGTPTAVAETERTATLPATGEVTPTPTIDNATPTADAPATAAAAATATEIAQERATVDARTAATATARAGEQATAAAYADATATAEEGLSALAALAVSAVTDITAGQPVFGPVEGSLLHLEDGFIEAEYAPDVVLADFVAEATFFTPYSRLEGSWDFGFMFRDMDTDDQYRLAIESNGLWSLGNRVGDDFELVDEGEVDNLDTSVGGANTLLLYAQGDDGYLFLNGEFIARMDLAQRLEAGEIAVATGLYEGDEVEGAETVFIDFTIWAIETAGLDAIFPVADRPEWVLGL